MGRKHTQVQGLVCQDSSKVHRCGAFRFREAKGRMNLGADLITPLANRRTKVYQEILGGSLESVYH